MDDLISVEYRGINGELSAGDTVTVESCGAGVLRLRAAAPLQPAPEEPLQPETGGNDADS